MIKYLFSPACAKLKLSRQTCCDKISAGTFPLLSQEISKNLAYNPVLSFQEGVCKMRSIEVVQQMIDWIEENMEESPTLQKISSAVGYSPWYCSSMFHDITGVTLKAYIAGRRLARITEEIRDTKERILDIAVKYGFSSQEALTRAFKEQYGCTPAAYRKENRPVPMTVKKHVLFPNYEEKRIKIWI